MSGTTPASAGYKGGALQALDEKDDYVLVKRSQVRQQQSSTPLEGTDRASDTSVAAAPAEQKVAQAGPSGRAAMTLPSRMLMRSMGRGISLNTVVPTRLVADIGVTSTAGGVVYQANNLYTLLISLGENTDFVSLFREFRISACKFKFIPFTPYKAETAINTNGRVICFAVDPENASTPSSVLQVFANASAVIGSNQMPLKLNWKNSDKLWYSTASTTVPLQPVLSFKMAADSNMGVSTPLGTVFVEFFVEYRARL